MKKLLTVAAITCVIVACADQNKTEKKEETKEQEETASKASLDSLRANPDYKKGLELIAKSDCISCHQVDDRNVGPGYREIANKYEATEENIKLLAGKIKKGGMGVWGSVPMTPHPDLSDADLKQMVKYIFLLKKK